MGVEYTGTIIVIPTRNRASLAEAAIRSVLQQDRSDIGVLVSDNSTSQDSLDELSRFCLSTGSDSVRYVRPPSSLRMTPHWDWALRVALKHWDYSHVSFLTDRMVFKPGALEDLAGIAKHRPDRIISYMHDRIADNQIPIRLDQHPWTGKLFQVAATRLLQLSSQSILHEMLPRMLNAIVPRRVLLELKERHGKFFDSHAPDFNFCYRALALEESIVFYDKALLVHYALDRSNGAAASSGAGGDDREDYISGLREQQGYFAVPAPEILTARNSVTHEYCVARSEAISSKFPPLDKQRYLETIAGELAEMTNAQLRQETEELLIAQGWTRPGLISKPALFAQKLSPKRVARKLASEARTLRSRVAGDSTSGRLSREAREFANLEAALDYSIQSQRPRVESQPSLEKLFGLVHLPREASPSAHGRQTVR